MNRYLLPGIFVFLALLTSPLASFDFMWGGEVNLNGEAPELQGTVLAATTTDSLNLWFDGSWNDLIKLRVDASGVFEADFRYGVAIDTQELGYFGNETVFYPSLKEFNLFGEYDRFYYRAGRQVLRDPGMLVVSHPGDGLLFGSRLGPTSLDVQAVYTGYVHENASNLSLSVNDLSGDHEGSFTSPRMIEKLTWTYPGFYKQNLSLSFIAQQDLHQSGDMVEGSEEMHSQYLQLVLKGFLIPSLAYRLSAVGQAGTYGDADIRAGLGRMEITFLPPKSKSALGADVIYSTGDSWDRVDYYASGLVEDKSTLNQYVPISSVSGQGYVEVFELGNLTSLSVFYIHSRRDAFSAEIRGTTFLRTTSGPVSSTLVLNDGKEDSFIGQEGLLSLLFQPAADLRLGFRTGVLYMGEIITITEELDQYLPVLARLGVDLSLSF